MIFACWLAFHTSGAGRVNDTVEIPILHRRASVVLGKMEPLDVWGVKLTADDSKGVILAVGPVENILSARQCAELFDVARRQFSIKVIVDSVADKVKYEATATILNNQEWRTSDTDTGVSVSVQPRINDDGTVTFSCKLNSALVRETNVVFRAKKGQTQIMAIGDPKWDGRPWIRDKPTSALEPVVKITLEKL